MSYNEGAPRKTFPIEVKRATKANNKPECPSVSMQTLPKLAIKLGGRIPLAGGNVEIKKVHTNGETVFKLTPLVREPLTHIFSNNHGATSGGGTSKDALRRAKKKAKKSPRK